MKDMINIGFIGCGGMARVHMQSLNEVATGRVVAVCDFVDERAREAAELTGGEPYTDHQEMLHRDDLDAVYVNIPVFAHGEPELAVIDRGLPFFVEKPVARTRGLANKILGKLQQKNLLMILLTI